MLSSLPSLTRDGIQGNNIEVWCRSQWHEQEQWMKQDLLAEIPAIMETKSHDYW